VRNVTYFSDTGYNSSKIFEEAKAISGPIDGIVEYVFNASFITVYLIKFQTVVKMSLNHLFTPANTDKDTIAEGKTFTEKLILHRTVGIKFDKVEEGGNLSGRVLHPAGDIAYEVVKSGFSKLNIPKNIDFDAEYYRKLKEAQLIAQTKKLRIWKDYKMEESKQNKASQSDFNGKVVEVHSGDSLTVERDSDKQLIRLFFTTVKAPAMVKKDSDESEPYAWESKEMLRKTTIGKKVKVVMEQSRKVTGKTGEERNMDFGTVFLQKNNKNISCALLEKGLLKTTVSKSGDNASKFLEDLLAAEKKAVDAKLGVHSPNPAPLRIYNDLTNNPKKAKNFEVMVMKRPNKKLNGVVEYCFSGMRFKVRLDSENTSISFSILGIKTMSNDKNQPQ
jgi:endonuclease YncB( thermonuclease family)